MKQKRRRTCKVLETNPDSMRISAEETRLRDAKAKRQWRKEHPEKHREQQKLYRLRYPERDRRKSSRYYAANSDKVKTKAHRRRLSAFNAGISFNFIEWVRLCRRYGNICLRCKEAKPLTPDHVVPLSKGGSGSIDNIQPLCLECNQKKYIDIVDYRPKGDSDS